MGDIKPQAGAGFQKTLRQRRGIRRHMLPLYVLSPRNYQITFAPIWM